jgi:predicted permease
MLGYTRPMLSELFGILAPTFLSALSGWLWVRSGRAFDRALIGDLIALIGAPCLVFASLTSVDVRPSAMLEIGSAALAALAVFTVVGFVFLSVAGLPRRSLMAPLVFGNHGNMAVPVCLFAFGIEGQALALVFFAVAASLQFSFGLFLWSGRFDPMELVRNPVGLAALAAALALGFDVPVPGVVVDTTGLLGAFAIPLMLVALGAAIAELEVTDLRKSLGLASFRLLVGVVVGFSLAWAIGLQGTARGVFILQCAMPAAVFNFLFAQRFDRDPALVASLVVVSTLLGAALLPFLLPALL